MSVEIVLTVTQSTSQHRIVLTDAPLHIGRAPDNDLSLIDDQLSWHHAIFWQEDGAVWVRDLASTNGTHRDGARLTAPTRLAPLDVVTLGGRVTLRVEQLEATGPGQRFVLEDLTGGLRHTLRVCSLTPTAAADLGLTLPGTLTVSDDGGLTLQTPSGVRALELEEVVETESGRLRIVSVETLRVQTVGQGSDAHPYQLVVDLDAPRGSVAVFTHIHTGQVHRMTSETRVLLVYQLARKIVADVESDCGPEQRGWCSDRDLCIGIWGRTAGSSAKLAVLVHRVRKELTQAGFDVGVLEKDLWVLRLRIADVTVR